MNQVTFLHELIYSIPLDRFLAESLLSSVFVPIATIHEEKKDQEGEFVALVEGAHFPFFGSALSLDKIQFNEVGTSLGPKELEFLHKILGIRGRSWKHTYNTTTVKAGVISLYRCLGQSCYQPEPQYSIPCEETQRLLFYSPASLSSLMRKAAWVSINQRQQSNQLRESQICSWTRQGLVATNSHRLEMSIKQSYKTMMLKQLKGVRRCTCFDQQYISISHYQLNS